jgi:hypothetical protein
LTCLGVGDQQIEGVGSEIDDGPAHFLKLKNGMLVPAARQFE